MTRDHRHMRTLLDTIMTVWAKYPELRLGQLLDNAMARTSVTKADLFNVDDSALTACLWNFDNIITAGGGTADTLGSAPSAPKGA